MGQQPDEPGEQGAVLASVPLFPLPNVVLFPRAVLPLHIFEERYKAMTADALNGDKQIAMALLRAGWEKNYYGKPSIEPVVCVGTIVSHERLADGKYNFLLQGHSRAVVERESLVDGETPYRRADLRLMVEAPLMEIDLSNERLRLTSLLGEESYAAMPLGKQFLQMLSSPLATADVVDLIAFNMLDDVPMKQQLLAEPNSRKRAARVIAALQAMRPMVELATGKIDARRKLELRRLTGRSDRGSGRHKTLGGACWSPRISLRRWLMSTENRTGIEAFEREFRKAKSLSEQSIAQVDDAVLYVRINDRQNSVAVIMQHVGGNLLSRFTDFLTTDGEKPTRDRESEFVDRQLSRADLLAFWERGWHQLFQSLAELSDADLSRVVTIRNEPHTVTLALIRSVTHCHWHAGQIALIAKHLKGDSWRYLTVPPGGSAAFNARMSVK